MTSKPQFVHSHINSFFSSINSSGLSDKTLVNYRSDIAHFAKWISNYDKTLNETTGEEYRIYLHEVGASQSTINRRLSTLRKFSGYLYINSIVSFDFMDGIRNLNSPVDDPKGTANSFRKELEAQGTSVSTRLNYVSDVSSFLRWLDSKGETIDSVDLHKQVARYLKEKSQIKSKATVKRYEASLRKFGDWYVGTPTITHQPEKSFDLRASILFIMLAAGLVSPLVTGTTSPGSPEDKLSKPLTQAQQVKNVSLQVFAEEPPLLHEDTNAPTAAELSLASDSQYGRVSSLDENLEPGELIEELALPLVGRGKIYSGQREATIYHPEVSSASVILVTQLGEPIGKGISVREQGDGYFVVSVGDPVGLVLEFNWLIQN